MTSVPISEKHLKEMSPDRDFPGPNAVTRRYAILSSPRSGSTLLSRALYETGKAGDPQEYFNPPLLQVERERTGRADLNINQFLRRMEKRRTSPNGVFGIKMHFSQMLAVHGSRKVTPAMGEFLRKFSGLVWIRRRDRLAQGVSQAIARRTNVWSSEDSRFKKDPDVKIHPVEVLDGLRMVCADDAGWERILRVEKLPVLEIWYEDLVERFEPEMRRVIDHLGLASEVTGIPQQPLEKQGGALNENVRAELLRYLGAAQAAG